MLLLFLFIWLFVLIHQNINFVRDNAYATVLKRQSDCNSVTTCPSPPVTHLAIQNVQSAKRREAMMLH